MNIPGAATADKELILARVASRLIVSSLLRSISGRLVANATPFNAALPALLCIGNEREGINVLLP
jgi:hypothetical protein